MKKNFFPTYIIFFIVLALSVGYAAFGSELSISNIVAEVRINADIRVTNFIYTEGTNGGLSSYDNYNVESLLTTINLPNANSTATYKVRITNIGNAEMGIYALNNLPSNLTYSITNYTLKDKLCDSNNKCSNGSVKEFYITIKYTDTGYNSSNTEYNLNLGVDFRRFYTITYEDITNNGYPTEIIEGDNIKITFTNPVPNSLTVYLNGLELNSSQYSYSNNVFTLNNVSGNLVLYSPNTLYSFIKSSTNGIDTNINFESLPTASNGLGVNTLSGTENDEYPVYYYRGAVNNNNVLFANLCWKIVRTTSTGGIKLIYNGAPASNGSCNNTGTSSQIGTSVFNNSKYIAYVGYMYGTSYTNYSVNFGSSSKYFGNSVTYSNGTYTLQDTYKGTWKSARTTFATKYHYTCNTTGTTCTTVYYVYFFSSSSSGAAIKLSNGLTLASGLESMRTNEKSSAIKSVVDSWYETNMTNYTGKLEDEKWCNDRSFYSGALKGENEDGMETNFFGAAGRSKTPSISCLQASDRFTVNKENGNGNLTYPVGLLTVDEARLAGITASSSASSYLYTGNKWWTMSPSHQTNLYVYNYYISNEGAGALQPSAEEYGVRPTISLKEGTKLQGGDGSVATPYIVQ